MLRDHDDRAPLPRAGAGAARARRLRGRRPARSPARQGGGRPHRGPRRGDRVRGRGSGCGGATLLEAAPRTGRTHQIRVHLRAIGHPILGDRALRRRAEPTRRRSGLTRPFLHSWRIAFDHPITGERDRARGAAARPISRRRCDGRAPPRPAALDAPAGRAYVLVPPESQRVSSPQVVHAGRWG